MKSLSYSLSILLVLFVFGCSQRSQQEEPMQSNEGEMEMSQSMDSAAAYTKAVAVIHPTEGNEVTGSVTFEQVDDGVKVHAELQGLSEGKHGFHIHEYGDCSAADGTSAGGHFNPTNKQHGAPTAENRHVGDMGNIEAGADGSATLDYVDHVISLNGSNSIIGHGIIVHGGEDDLTSQPSGAAGPRVGCGVIGIANTGSM